MHTYDDALAAIMTYSRKYRRDDVPPLEIVGLCDLDPHLEGADARVTSDWSKPWPNNHRFGVYLIFDERVALLYVGKSSGMGIGRRLYDWFGQGERCRVSPGHWSRRPRYVLSAAVPVEMHFEASALEEYLIRELDPCDNARGRLRTTPVA